MTYMLHNAKMATVTEDQAKQALELAVIMSRRAAAFLAYNPLGRKMVSNHNFTVELLLDLCHIENGSLIWKSKNYPDGIDIMDEAQIRPYI